ncbi:Tetraspanin-33 [Lamellibrachia satsuma]|nr:Tetraspanin-33 [Lamellibrachia satsuma]
MDRAPRRQLTEYVKSSVKYSVFIFNVIFLLSGFVIAGAGLWIKLDKIKEIRLLLQEVVDPAILVIIAGCVLFTFGFLGCVGALRENLTLLRWYYTCLIAFVLAQLIGMLSVLILYAVPAIRKEISYFNPSKALKMCIIRYQEDDDLRNMIDAIQRKLKCCGHSYSGEGYKDWGENAYFNCSKDNKSVSRCGVPHSCCKPKKDNVINVMCGYSVVGLDTVTLSKKIYLNGCLKGFEDWMNTHLFVVGGMIIAVFVPQLMAIRSAWMLHSQIRMQILQWR